MAATPHRDPESADGRWLHQEEIERLAEWLTVTLTAETRNVDCVLLAGPAGSGRTQVIDAAVARLRTTWSTKTLPTVIRVNVGSGEWQVSEPDATAVPWGNVLSSAGDWLQLFGAALAPVTPEAAGAAAAIAAGFVVAGDVLGQPEIVVPDGADMSLATLLLRIAQESRRSSALVIAVLGVAPEQRADLAVILNHLGLLDGNVGCPVAVLVPAEPDVVSSLLPTAYAKAWHTLTLAPVMADEIRAWWGCSEPFATAVAEFSRGLAGPISQLRRVVEAASTGSSPPSGPETLTLWLRSHILEVVQASLPPNATASRIAGCLQAIEVLACVGGEGDGLLLERMPGLEVVSSDLIALGTSTGRWRILTVHDNVFRLTMLPRLLLQDAILSRVPTDPLESTPSKDLATAYVEQARLVNKTVSVGGITALLRLAEVLHRPDIAHWLNEMLAAEQRAMARQSMLDCAVTVEAGLGGWDDLRLLRAGQMLLNLSEPDETPEGTRALTIASDALRRARRTQPDASLPLIQALLAIEWRKDRLVVTTELADLVNAYDTVATFDVLVRSGTNRWKTAPPWSIHCLTHACAWQIQQGTGRSVLLAAQMSFLAEAFHELSTAEPTGSAWQDLLEETVALSQDLTCGNDADPVGSAKDSAVFAAKALSQEAFDTAVELAWTALVRGYDDSAARYAAIQVLAVASAYSQEYANRSNRFLVAAIATAEEVAPAEEWAWWNLAALLGNHLDEGDRDVLVAMGQTNVIAEAVLPVTPPLLNDWIDQESVPTLDAPNISVSIEGVSRTMSTSLKDTLLLQCFDIDLAGIRAWLARIVLEARADPKPGHFIACPEHSPTLCDEQVTLLLRRVGDLIGTQPFDREERRQLIWKLVEAT